MSSLRLLILLSAVLVVSGCATSRGTIDIAVTETANPAEGTAVVITSVRDNRIFELDPRQPSTPSLKGDEIFDTAITSRAIARKRNSYGAALGDILLPEGETVADLVKGVVANALRQTGYRVLDDSPSDGEFAVLEVGIEKFWSWFNPGFWSIATNFEAAITLSSDDPRLVVSLVTAEFRDKAMTAGEGQWRMTIESGLVALREALHQELNNSAM